MIWITRSEPGAGVLAEALQASGFDVWCQPLIEIEPLRPFQAWVARGQWAIESAAAPDLIIALSGHAVREYLASALVRLAGDAPHIAVGAGTAALLTDAGFEVTQPGEATSEGILAMPQLAVLTAQHKVWILAGAGGRELVLQQLAEQAGCEVVKFELYRRRRATLQELPVAALGWSVSPRKAPCELSPRFGGRQAGLSTSRYWCPRNGWLIARVPWVLKMSIMRAARAWKMCSRRCRNWTRCR